MVELTARDLAHLPQVEVAVGDARAPDLPRASFDVVAASLVLFFLPDPAAALRAWTDLLVDRGRLGVSTLGEKDRGGPPSTASSTRTCPPDVVEARTRGLRGPYASDDGVERLFFDAGLADVTTVTDSVEAVFRDPEQFVRVLSGRTASGRCGSPSRRPTGPGCGTRSSTPWRSSGTRQD